MRRFNFILMLFTALCWTKAVMAQAQFAFSPSMPSRIEVHALPTKTLSGEEFLKGSTQGQSHVLAAELRIPQGQKAKFPAVVLIHGSGGVSGSMDLWVHALNQAGIATLVVDTFSGRGITSTVQDQTLLHSLAMMVDSYRALDLLAKHPRIDASKISIMGFSKGAVASMFSASTRFKAMYGSSAQFASHIGLYAPCNTRFIGDTDVTGSPMRFFSGISDDYVSVGPCRTLVAELKSKNVDVTLAEFENTQHSYDSPLAPEKLAIPGAQSTRNCQIIEKPKGELINAESGKPFSLNDSCIAIGAHIGHNPDSTAKTVKSVVAFLQSL